MCAGAHSLHVTGDELLSPTAVRRREGGGGTWHNWGRPTLLAGGTGGAMLPGSMSAVLSVVAQPAEEGKHYANFDAPTLRALLRVARPKCIDESVPFIGSAGQDRNHIKETQNKNLKEHVHTRGVVSRSSTDAARAFDLLYKRHGGISFYPTKFHGNPDHWVDSMVFGDSTGPELCWFEAKLSMHSCIWRSISFTIRWAGQCTHVCIGL